MKKILVSLGAVAFFGLLALFLFEKFGRSYTVSAQKSDASEKRQSDRKLAAKIRELTNRSDEGLLQEVLPDGSVSMDLQGRFQNVMLGKLDSNGEPVAACVASLDEANRFFGKNLETGEAMPGREYERESIDSIAARHGMTKDEFLFYSKMASDAVRQQVLASPQSATITINNLDGTSPAEGFNDTTAAAPEGGNTGTTRGAQRLNLFNFAAGIWGAFLDSNVSIGINSQFNPLTPCSTSGGVLGSAGTININRNFTNAEFTNTWYHAALANKRAGSDLVPANAEMQATFNSDVDNGCLGAGTRFYYGLDNTTPGGRINLLVVLLHEMGHGLGFSSFVNGSTGALNGGFPDIYTRYMFDQTTGLYWHQMTDAQRAASALNTNNVLWDGPNVRLASSYLTAGRDAGTGRVQLFTPNPFQGGSSISHFSTAAAPNLLMEPSINVGLPIDLDLTRQQMRDIGWFRDTTSDQTADTITNVTPNGGGAVIGQNRTIVWANNGGFNRNVTIELSTDGGATYPTMIASNIANTGTFSWTVPNTPTSTARVRVREHNFVAPSGASSANFTISLTPLAGNATVTGRVIDASGRSVSRATVVLTDAHGTIRTAISNPFGYFVFEDVPVGEAYVANVRHKRYRFDQQIINLTDNYSGLDFVAMP